jgi:hypothetical protein
VVWAQIRTLSVVPDEHSFCPPKQPKAASAAGGLYFGCARPTELLKSCHFVADMCSGGGVVQVRLGDKGQHPQSIVHNVQTVQRFVGQKRDLSPVGPAPRTAGELSFASS